MNGHKFIQKQFYQIILCAFCNEFLLNALGYQCEDCRYTCHKKCYEKVVTKCISKSTNELVGACLIVSIMLISIFFTRIVMRLRSIIVFHIASESLLTLVQTGAATVVTCFLLDGKMLASARNVSLLVMRPVHISFPTSAVCQWRQRIFFSDSYGR